MRLLPHILSLLVCGLLSLPAQQLYAIVTMAATNPTESNARFVIELDSDNAPRSVAQLMMLADPSAKLYRNRSVRTFTNNPSGTYNISNAAGFALYGGVDTYSISVNGSTSPVNVSNGSIATVTRSNGGDTVATFVLSGSSWIHQRDTFDPYQFRIYYNNSTNINRFMLEVTVDLPYLQAANGTLTSGPFYDASGPIPVTSGTFPFLTIGEKISDVNISPGWVLPNEVINPAASSIDSSAIFGNHFVNSFGNVSTSQRYAVAFANEDLTSPNTAASKLLITGFAGNPNFEGRYTYIGEIFFGSYQNSGTGYSTIVPGSRALVDALLNGSRSASLTSIHFENSDSPIAPIDGETTVPALSLSTSQPCLDFSSLNSPRLRTNSSIGQVRLIETSLDLEKWFRAGQSSYPPNALSEPGFAFSRNLDRQFFRVNPLAVTYPTWPSQLFSHNNKQLLFKGLAIDSTSGPQALNFFQINLDPSGFSGTLIANGGDLDGSHTLTNVVYSVTGPYQAELSMESATLSDTLKLRLYFDAHQAQESSSSPIDRFHRILSNSVISSLEEKNEFGLWQIQ